ncbi:MAG: methyltransferase domain-containing protein [Candidatus Bathyarchaeia archaeon]
MPSQWKRKRSVIRHYDRTAKTYDTQYGEEQDAKITAALESLNHTDSSAVLDAGCGTGLLFHHIANHAKLIIGIDTSKALLKQAKSKAPANTHVIRADADHIPFHDKTFTLVFAFTLLQNMPQPENTLEELKRVTRHNARIVITGLKKNFTKENFTQVLENADLEAVSMRIDEKLKDYIAVCRKRPTL